MSTLIWHRLDSRFFADPDDTDPDAFVPVAILATDDLEEAFKHSQNVEDAWFTHPSRVLQRFSHQPERSTSVGDVIEDLTTHERYLVAWRGFTSLGPMPASAILPQRPFLHIWRSDGGKVLPAEQSLIVEVWSGYALVEAYAELQQEVTVDWVRTHVAFGDIIRRSGPADQGDDDLCLATIQGEMGYARICGLGRHVLGIDDA